MNPLVIRIKDTIRACNAKPPLSFELCIEGLLLTMVTNRGAVRSHTVTWEELDQAVYNPGLAAIYRLETTK